MITEPCGNIPQRGAYISIHYCEHHMAWTVSSNVTRTDELDNDMYLYGPRTDFLGPFDSASDVLELTCDRLAKILHAIGLDWAQIEPSTT